METEIDLWRMPDRKDASGWRGPCELLDISHKDNTAIVKHQSIPYIVPLRHIRPHVGALLAILIFRACSVNDEKSLFFNDKVSDTTDVFEVCQFQAVSIRHVSGLKMMDAGTKR